MQSCFFKIAVYICYTKRRYFIMDKNLNITNSSVISKSIDLPDNFYLTAGSLEYIKGVNKDLVDVVINGNDKPASFYDSKEAEGCSHFIKDVMSGDISDAFLLAGHVFLTIDGDIFLGKRANNVLGYQNTWTIPTGRCSELPRETCIKELLEEVAIIIESEHGGVRPLMLGDINNKEHMLLAEKALNKSNIELNNIEWMAAETDCLESLRNHDLYLFQDEILIDILEDYNVIHDKINNTIEIGKSVDVNLPSGWKVKNMYFTEHPEGHCELVNFKNISDYKLAFIAEETINKCFIDSKRKLKAKNGRKWCDA